MIETMKTSEYSQDIEAAALAALNRLPDMPPGHKKSARQIIINLAPVIRERISSGYTHQQVVEALNEAGFNIAAATLKTYLSTAPKGFSDKNAMKRRSQKTLKVEQSATRTQHSVDAVTDALNNGHAVSRPAFQDPDEK